MLHSNERQPGPELRQQLPPILVKQNRYLILMRNWDHQFRLWGFDIKHPGTDLMSLFGLKCLPKRADYSNSAAYLTETQAETSFGICLWAFGAYLHQPGYGLWFWSRHHLRLNFAPGMNLSDPWALMKNPEFTRAPTYSELITGLEVLKGFTHWICEYERWIQTHFGSHHRMVQIGEPESLADYWDDITEKLLIETPARGPRVGIEREAKPSTHTIQLETSHGNPCSL
jgi:hypothetical protein